MDLADHLRTARNQEGCPLGSDEALLVLASPPLYTPFPNPFVEQFLAATSRRSAPATPPYSREPVAVDTSVGRTDPAYLAQSYHTKVPHLAITRYLEHFTDPGDLVLDGFCGSGMVGVAANQTRRRALLFDLSPAATLIARGYCHPFDLAEAEAAFGEVLRALDRECGWLYRDIDYVIWSELFACPHCSTEFPFAQAGFDFERRRPVQRVLCPSCGAALHPHDLVRSLDPTGKTKEVPTRVAYLRRGRPREVAPGPDFFELQQQIDNLPIPHWYPDNPMMNRLPSTGGWGDMWRRGYHSGMERVSDFYFKRTLWALATAVHLVARSGASLPTKQLMLQLVVNSSTALTRMRRAYQGVLPLVLYIPKLKREMNVPRVLAARFRHLVDCLRQINSSEQVLISTQSTTSLANVPDRCVDYIFTDPPFGDNIRYSEVNFLWESWLRVFTNRGPEAIISPGQGKDVAEYQELLRRCFVEMHRVLKPGRWITVAFHNSESRVWNAVQEALRDAGFRVAEVRLLDKRQVSFKQASANTVRRDLVISAQRASVGTLGRRGASSPATRDPATAGAPRRGEAETAWVFVRQRLSHLPLPVPGDGETEPAVERRPLALFNRMVAAHLRRGMPVPLDAQQFYSGLRPRFEERDGMLFLPEQAEEYDRLVAASAGKL